MSAVVSPDTIGSRIRGFLGHFTCMSSTSINVIGGMNSSKKTYIAQPDSFSSDVRAWDDASAPVECSHTLNGGENDDEPGSPRKGSRDVHQTSHPSPIGMRTPMLVASLPLYTIPTAPFPSPRKSDEVAGLNHDGSVLLLDKLRCRYNPYETDEPSVSSELTEDEYLDSPVDFATNDVDVAPVLPVRVRPPPINVGLNGCSDYSLDSAKSPKEFSKVPAMENDKISPGSVMTRKAMFFHPQVSPDCIASFQYSPSSMTVDEVLPSKGKQYFFPSGPREISLSAIDVNVGLSSGAIY